jgi:hypothetical protein
LHITDEDGEAVIFQPRKTAKSASKTKTKQVPAAETKSAKSSKAKSEVYINRIKLDPDKLKTLETLYQTRIENGHYWYDKLCGAWGVENGPTVGFIIAGLDLAGPMPPTISGGGTGIIYQWPRDSSPGSTGATTAVWRNLPLMKTSNL